MVSLLVPVAAYLPAEALGVSGVLAASSPGSIAGRRRRPVLNAGARLRASRVWDIVLFIINGLVFMLIGLQLPVDPRGPRRLPGADADRPRRSRSA